MWRTGWRLRAHGVTVALMNLHLYRQARDFPRTLAGGRRLATFRDLTQEGLSRGAARWRAGHDETIAAPFHGIYLIGTTPVDLLDRARAALAASPPHAVLGFQTAAALQGFGVYHSDDVHVVVAADAAFPQRAGIRVHRSVVPPEPVIVHGVACTAPARTAIDLARTLPRPDALAVLDAALSAQACTDQDLAEEVRLHKGLKGYRQLLRVVPLADRRSQCTQETHLRLILCDGGLTDFEPQVEVQDSYGDTVYRLDLAERRLRVAAEYDGSSHLDRGRMREDRARHNYLSTRHWRIRYFTDRDIYGSGVTIVPTMRSALADALADPYIAARRTTPIRPTR